MKKLILIVLGVMGLVLSANAQLGWSLGDCKQKYGKVLETQKLKGDRLGYFFKYKGILITVAILDGKVSRVAFGNNKGKWTSEDMAQFLLTEAPNAKWGKPITDNEGNGSLQGFVNGELAYYAAINSKQDVMAVWTKADDDTLPN